MLLEQLKHLIEPEADELGFILWGIELDAFSSDTGTMTLRIFIDHEEGISVDDCQVVSQAVSTVLDVEDPISSAYALEVSSPGVNRKVFTAVQAASLEGFEVKVNLIAPLNSEDKRRRFKGVIEKVDDQVVYLLVEGETVKFDFVNVDKMRVVAKF